MLEVYNLIIELEKHEEDLLQSKLEGDKMSKAEEKLKTLKIKSPKHNLSTLDKKIYEKRDIFQKALSLRQKKRTFEAYQLLKKTMEEILKENERRARERKEALKKMTPEEQKLELMVHKKPNLNDLVNKQIAMLCRKLENEMYEKDRGGSDIKKEIKKL
jgi:hypothetical protein